MSSQIQELIEYVDLKIRKLQEELEYLKNLREFLEYKIGKLSIEPSSKELPANGRRPASLAVELNPVDELGKPTKKRGLVLRSGVELEEFRKLINDEKLTTLMGKIDEVNPRSSMVRKRGAGGEAFEI